MICTYGKGVRNESPKRTEYLLSRHGLREDLLHTIRGPEDRVENEEDYRKRAEEEKEEFLKTRRTKLIGDTVRYDNRLLGRIILKSTGRKCIRRKRPTRMYRVTSRVIHVMECGSFYGSEKKSGVAWRMEGDDCWRPAPRVGMLHYTHGAEDDARTYCGDNRLNLLLWRYKSQRDEITNFISEVSRQRQDRWTRTSLASASTNRQQNFSPKDWWFWFGPYVEGYFSNRVIKNINTESILCLRARTMGQLFYSY